MRGARYAAPAGLRGWKEAAGRGGRGTLLELDLGASMAQVGIGADGSLRLRAGLHGKPPPRPEDALERARHLLATHEITPMADDVERHIDSVIAGFSAAATA